MISRSLYCIWIFTLYGICKSVIAESINMKKPRDVFFIIIDDLRQVSDDTNIKAPHITELMKNGANFANAYAQQALCAPSRNSILTGRRPDSLRLYDFYSYWRDNVANFSTIPQVFKENGYQTQSVGKVFHHGPSSNYTDDYPYSWSLPAYHPPTLKYKDSPVCPGPDRNLYSNLVCPVDVTTQPAKTLPDLESVKRAIDIIENRDPDIPLFLAIGFYKPHIPLKCPKEFLKLYPLESIKLADYNVRPYDMPVVAWHPWTDVKKRDDIASLNISFPFGYMPDQWARRIKQSYYSCVSYIDSLIGDLLQHIDKENSVIVITSDHGWNLGENGMWAKYSNFDVALKVPLIFNAPDIVPSVIIEPVELIDVFPTLIKLAGIDVHIPHCTDNTQTVCYEGKSLHSIIHTADPLATGGHVAYSQYPRPSWFPVHNSDKPKLKDITIMGYSLRTSRFRYTEWVNFNSTSFVKNWTIVYGRELYDSTVINGESLNLSNRNGLNHLTQMLSTSLKKQFE